MRQLFSYISLFLILSGAELLWGAVPYFETDSLCCNVSKYFADNGLEHYTYFGQGLFFNESGRNIYYSEKGLPAKYIKNSFNGIPLYRESYGNSPLNGLYPLAPFLKVEKKDTSSASKLGLELRNLYSDRPDWHLNVNGGNALGQINGLYSGKYNFISVAIGGAYSTSAGYPVSKKTDRNVFAPAGLLNNSDFDASSILFCAKIDGGNSFLNITAMQSEYAQGYPADYSADTMIFKRNPTNRLSIMGMNFYSMLSSDANISGVIYYRNQYTIAKRYDDSTFDNQKLATSTNGNNEEYSYGAIFKSDYWLTEDLPLHLLFDYSREVFLNRFIEDVSFNKFEIEKLKLACGFNANILGVGIYGNLGQLTEKPLYSDISAVDYKVTGWEYELRFNAKASENIELGLDLSNNLRAPAMNELFFPATDSLYIPIESEKYLCTELSAIYSQDIWTGKLSVYRMGISDKIVPTAMQQWEKEYVNNGDLSYFGADLSFGMNYRNSSINIAMSQCNTPKDLMFAALPRTTVRLSASKLLFGTLQFEGEYLSVINRWSYSGGRYTKKRGEDLLQIGVKYLLFRSYMAEFTLYNALDSYYESSPGVPSPGRVFMIGLRAIL